MSRILKNFAKYNVQFVRCKHKENHWSVQRRKKMSTQKALDHFDDFYDQVFKSKWPTIRKGLLSKSKYVAVVNNYSDSNEICTQLEARAAINVRKLFSFQKELLDKKFEEDKRKDALAKIWKMEMELNDKEAKPEAVEGTTKPNLSLEKSLKEAEYDTSRIVDGNLSSGILHEFIPATRIKGKDDFIQETHYYKSYDKLRSFPVNIEKEYDLHFPDHLNVYCYEEENHTEFPQPKKGTTGVYNYYLMDGGSLLPVLALDLRPGHRMLDICSAPGGKSYIALQTLYPNEIICNDSSMSRTSRIKNVLKQYFFDLEEKWLTPGKIKITCMDARYITEDNFDRILVDVPCTTDRHSVKEDENNIFRPDRIKERLKLPELQSEILYNALKLVKVGGVVVYSTCSLSPLQNDGVVHMTLKKLWEDTKIEVQIKDLNTCLQQVKDIYTLASPKLLKYGHLVLPMTAQNFGPTYFCKLKRVS